MENYLMLNNKKINLTPEQVEQIKKSYGFNNIMLKDVKVGETFKVGDLEFIALEHSAETTAVILKEFWKTTKFDTSCNNYAESSIRKELNTEFYQKISAIVGKKNIVKHKVDLTAGDGRTEYKSCVDNISLLTCERYRKYVYTLNKYRINNWWWLATAYSTKSNNYTTAVRVVNSYGALHDSLCNYDYGVRPFCILKSNIFVSK